jgi:hypothetical protein
MLPTGINWKNSLKNTFNPIFNDHFSEFVYDGMGNAYFRCFYITMKTAISVGMNVKPDRELPAEMIFMGTLWLLGIFVFAVLIGFDIEVISL